MVYHHHTEVGVPFSKVQENGACMQEGRTIVWRNQHRIGPDPHASCYAALSECAVNLEMRKCPQNEPKMGEKG